MKRFFNERNFYLLLSLAIATGLWFYVTHGGSVRVDRPGVRVVPVVPTIVGEPAYGYSLLGIRVVPPTVSITGDPRALEPVRTVATEPVTVSGVTHDINPEVAVLTPPGVAAGTRVRVSIQIVPAVAVTVLRGIPVRVSDAPAGMTITMRPATIEAHLQGPLLIVTRLRPDQFTATVDAADLPVGQHRLPVRITAPPEVEVLEIHPAEIVVTVSRGG